MRKALFWLHLVTGVAVGLLVLIMSATGVILTYERQILEWADRDYRSEPQPGNSRVKTQVVVDNVRSASKGEPSGMTVSSDPGAPVAVTFGRDKTVYADAYSGAVLGVASQGIRSFLTSMLEWHRWLASSAKNRVTARTATGVANLAFLFLICTGMILWIPREWTSQKVRAVAFFRRGLKGKARDFNWHNTIGIWCALPLVLIVASGAVMSFGWANDLVYKVMGTPPPSRPSGGPNPGRSGNGAVYLQPEAVDAAIAAAAERTPGWKSISVRFAGSARAPLQITIDLADRGRPDQRIQAVADATTGEISKVENFSDYPAGRRARTWLRWIHTGEAGGVIGQTIAGAASFGALVLVWTGISLTLQRNNSWRRRRMTPSGSISRPTVLESMSTTRERTLAECRLSESPITSTQKFSPPMPDQDPGFPNISKAT